MMLKWVQRFLLVFGVVGLIFIGYEIYIAVSSTMHGSTADKVIQVNAGPYPLTVNLYKYPPQAGFAMPFAVAPQQPVDGTLTYSITTYPHTDEAATPIRASFTPDSNVRNGIQGEAEITVQGLWDMEITVNGPQGPGTTTVPLDVVVPLAIPLWLGWLVGLIPLYGLLALLLFQRSKKNRQAQNIQTTNDSVEVVVK